ncbi:hypothetical protein CN378_00265 [Bacillus sp. AFS015802]|uniref:hypothetical protein n=1 Tax=Bacillus sp. AFS015802 TaxID=2033486 RepID=UPI000BF8C9C0|nr:hypothetical protein [Bacillus sp. AFS015802]PFA70738.1 hypothetical protein CN378_00265 [Bacillus sp. AFS015802]
MFWVWLVFVFYAMFLAPGKGFASDPIIQGLLQGKFSEVEPLVVTVFMFLGLFPLLFAALLLPVDRDNMPAWPFILGAFALGAFSLLPYFFLRKGHHRPVSRSPRGIHALLSSKAFSLLLMIMALASLTYLGHGFSLHSYWRAFQDSKLVSVMTVDFFILLWLSFYTMDSIYNIKDMRWLSLVPVIGPLMLRWKK